jgi:hypothetical protein
MDERDEDLAPEAYLAAFETAEPVEIAGHPHVVVGSGLAGAKADLSACTLALATVHREDALYRPVPSVASSLTSSTGRSLTPASA